MSSLVPLGSGEERIQDSENGSSLDGGESCRALEGEASSWRRGEGRNGRAKEMMGVGVGEAEEEGGGRNEAEISPWGEIKKIKIDI